jgi:hypothetical protein
MIESPVGEHAPVADTNMGEALSQDRIACLCRGFSLGVVRARHVVALSDELFAATGHLHGLTKPCRHLLHATAVLCAPGAPGNLRSGRLHFPETLLKSALPDLSASERRIAARSGTSPRGKDRLGRGGGARCGNREHQRGAGLRRLAGHHRRSRGG